MKIIYYLLVHMLCTR